MYERGIRMNGKQKWGFVPLIALALLVLAAEVLLAADPAKPELALTLVVRKEVAVQDASGAARTEWREVRESRPGDTLMYTVAYRNAGKAEARQARIVDPVPEGAVYVPGSAEGKDTAITYSIDGKAFREPGKLTYKVRRVDGSQEEQIATPEMYSHIQWTLTKPVPPGGTGTVSFKVRVR